MKITTLIGAFVLAGTCPTMWADVITQYDRAAFAAALNSGTVAGQNFDALVSGTVLTTLNGVDYSASFGSPLVTNAYLTTTPPNGLGSTSAGYFEGGETATFSFASPVTAFGLDINTFAPTPGDFEANLNTGAVAVSNFDVFPGNATGQFIGLTDSVPFTSVTIESLPDPGNGLQYTFTLDSLVYGDSSSIQRNPIPEPCSLFNMLCACALAPYLLSKRR